MLDPEGMKGFDDVLTRDAKTIRGFARQLEAVLATALRPNAPLTQLIEAMRRLQAGPPVAGYEALLLDVGCLTSEARLTARAIHYFGEALKQKNEAERFLASALRAIATAAGKSTIVIA